MVTAKHGAQDPQETGGTIASIDGPDMDPLHKYAIRAMVASLEIYKARSMLYVGCADMEWLRMAVEMFTISDKGFR